MKPSIRRLKRKALLPVFAALLLAWAGACFIDSLSGQDVSEPPASGAAPSPQSPSTSEGKTVNLLAAFKPSAKGMHDWWLVPEMTWVEKLYDVRDYPRLGTIDWLYFLGAASATCAETNWVKEDLKESWSRKNREPLTDKQIEGRMNDWLFHKVEGTALERELIAMALERLERDYAPFPEISEGPRNEFDELCRTNANPDDRRWFELYIRARTLRDQLSPMATAETLEQSIGLLKEVFGNECTQSQADRRKDLQGLRDAWKELAGKLRGADADKKILEFSAKFIDYRRKIWFGSKPLADYLSSCKNLDLREEWQQQLMCLYKDLSQQEWFKRPEVANCTFRREALILDSDRDPTDVVLRRTAALLEEIQQLPGAKPQVLAPLEQRLNWLTQKAAAIPVPCVDARYAIYFDACRIRRLVALANPLLDFDKIIFLKKPAEAPDVTYVFQQSLGCNALGGGGLFVLENPFSNQPRVRDVLEKSVVVRGRLEGQKLGPEGGFRSPGLSYDGKRIVFSWTWIPPENRPHVPGLVDPWRWYYAKWSKDLCYHIFSVSVDGSDLRQLTDGPYNEIDPRFMPDGRIIFVSERRGGFPRSRWWPGPSHTLHVMEPDGSNIRRLSENTTHEWGPVVDNTGAILFTRWDYFDTPYAVAITLYQMTQDGRDARQIYGHYGDQKEAHNGAPDTVFDVQPIPNSNRYIATGTPNQFGPAMGALHLIDPSVPDYDPRSCYRLTPELPTPYSETDRACATAEYGHPWPLSEVFWLCSYDWNATEFGGPAGYDGTNHYGVYLVDAFGNKTLLYRDSKFSTASPMPLRARPKPPAMPKLNLAPLLATMPAKDAAPQLVRALPGGGSTMPGEPATVGLVNVYDSLYAFPEGTHVKELRIWGVPPKTTPIKDVPRVRLGENSGSRFLIGSVPVEKDGSAHFKMPPNVPVYFQAVDEDGLAVQTMRSITYAKPGERLFCLGCHEPRNRAPSRRTSFPAAFRRTPSDIQPGPADTNPFSYPRLVQPVLKNNCVACHAADPKAPPLDKGQWRKDPDMFYRSARSLQPYVFGYISHASDPRRTPPGYTGARASKLYHLLKNGHHDLKLSPEDMNRLVLWMDSNLGYFSTQDHVEKQAAGEVVPYDMNFNHVNAMGETFVHTSDFIGNNEWHVGLGAVAGMKPGKGFRILGKPSGDNVAEEFQFGIAERWPLTAYYDAKHHLRLQTSYAPVNKWGCQYLLVYQTLQNVGKEPSAPIGVVEPIYAEFEPGGAWKLSGPNASVTKDASFALPLLVITSQESRQGLYCLMEWPGPGYVKFDRNVLRAGIDLGGLRLQPGQGIELPAVHIGAFRSDACQTQNLLRKYLQTPGVFHSGTNGFPTYATRSNICARSVDADNIVKSGILFGRTAEQAKLLARVLGNPKPDGTAPQWTAPGIAASLNGVSDFKAVQHLLAQQAQGVQLPADAKGWEASQYSRQDKKDVAVLVLGPGGGEMRFVVKNLLPDAKYEVSRRPGAKSEVFTHGWGYRGRPVMLSREGALGKDLTEKGLTVKLPANGVAILRLTVGNPYQQ